MHKPTARRVGIRDEAARRSKGSNHGASRVFNMAEAANQAIRTGMAVDAKSIFIIPIASLDGYDNPRHEPANCYEKGYTLIGDPRISTPQFNADGKCLAFVSLLHLATSDDLSKVGTFVKLIENNESVDRKEHPDAPQSIVELAEEIDTFGQWVPVSVKRTKSSVVLGDGGRRVCAALYLHARSRIRQLRGEADQKSIHPATIQATDLDCDEADLFVVSAKINLARKGFDHLQEGRVYHEMLKRINPATLKGGDLYNDKYPGGRNYTKKEAAEQLHVHYSTFRNREALWHEYRDTTEGRRGLTENERRAVQRGELLPTFASRLSLGESTRGVSRTDGAPVKTKHRSLSMQEMETLFDATPAFQIERRHAIADCMRLDYDEALRRSRSRMDDQMDRVEKDKGIGKRGRKKPQKAA